MKNDAQRYQPKAPRAKVRIAHAKVPRQPRLPEPIPQLAHCRVIIVALQLDADITHEHRRIQPHAMRAVRAEAVLRALGHDGADDDLLLDEARVGRVGQRVRPADVLELVDVALEYRAHGADGVVVVLRAVQVALDEGLQRFGDRVGEGDGSGGQFGSVQGCLGELGDGDVSEERAQSAIGLVVVRSPWGVVFRLAQDQIS